jgi:hypothetical protein
MKKACFQIVFCCVCKLRKESHLLNVASQWDYLSCLVCYLNQEKAKKIIFCHFWNIDKTIDYRINHILDEKINFEIKFDNHSRVFVLTQSINWYRFTLFSIFNSENKHIKHRVNFVNIDLQRFKTSFRITLSSRFFWFFKSFDYEMHEKCHRFATNFEMTIVQKDDERFKLRRMIKSYEKRKQISFHQWNLKAD